LQGWQHCIPFGCFVSVLHTDVAITPGFVVSLFPPRSQGMARAACAGRLLPSATEKKLRSLSLSFIFSPSYAQQLFQEVLRKKLN